MFRLTPFSDHPKQKTGIGTTGFVCPKAGLSYFISLVTFGRLLLVPLRTDGSSELSYSVRVVEVVSNVYGIVTGPSIVKRYRHWTFHDGERTSQDLLDGGVRRNWLGN